VEKVVIPRPHAGVGCLLQSTNTVAGHPVRIDPLIAARPRSGAPSAYPRRRTKTNPLFVATSGVARPRISEVACAPYRCICEVPEVPCDCHPSSFDARDMGAHARRQRYRGDFRERRKRFCRELEALPCSDSVLYEIHT